jgi:RND superfamily putative drug exporter
MTLVPAFLTLMGEKSWYIPRWLDRVLPNLTIEAPHDGEAPLNGNGNGNGRARPERPAEEEPVARV